MKMFRSNTRFFKAPHEVFKQNRDKRCFSSEKQESILEGIFSYKESFSAFVQGTRQKQETAEIIGYFASKLREKNVSFVKPQSTKILDLGPADGKNTMNYLREINQYLKRTNNSPGFEYWAVETNREFVEEAKATVKANPMIKKCNVIHGDALSGNLRWRKEFESLSFDFILASHIAYYIKNDELSCRAFLLDITKLLSKQCGIAIFLHEDSTHYFRATYNKYNFNFPTTPVMLENSACLLPANFNQFASIRFTSKLRFLPLSDELWEMTKSPELYKNCAYIPNFVDTLKKLAFIVQRDLIALAEEGTLAQYVDEVRGAIKANKYCLNLKTHMQIIVAPQCTLQNEIAQALIETEEKIPTIISKVANEETRNIVNNETEIHNIICQDQEQQSPIVYKF